jgi:hypothetical protein
MYSTMVRKQSRSGAVLLCLLMLAPSLSALEKGIELGKEKLWGQMISLEGVIKVPGRWGFQDLALASGEYSPDSATDLLMHFDAAADRDATNGWKIGNPGPLLSSSIAVMGEASAAFTGSRQGVSLQPPADGLFAAGTVWEDFTIEFWLYPATLSDGESVFSWSASVRQGAGKDARFSAQGFRCFLRDRKLIWEFQNLFVLPTGERLPVTLVGTRQLLPRVWHHHVLRFDSHEGLLEYRIDDAPEAILHTTDTGREGGSIAVPAAGDAYAGPLVIGAGLTGFLDELRVSRRYVADPVLSPLLGTTGSATSGIIDLGSSSTRISRIDAVASVPGDSSVEYFYQTADSWGGRQLLKSSTDWIPFAPGTDFKDTLRARYIQLRVELFPDGTRTHSPRVSDLTVVVEPNVPPAPPAGLTVTPGNGKVTLTWRKVNDLDLKGYMVYYGNAPHTYLGTGAVQGDSPIDAGTATTIVIDGLDNGSLYYFAVAAYDTSEPRQLSEFSPEASGRPSRIYK